MHRGIACLVLTSLLALSASLHSAQAIPFYPSTYSQTRHRDYLVEVEDPDAVLEMLAKLGQSILRAQHEGSNAKRGLDLGLGRGFSGSQAAKHLMGLAAANFAAGPGKRKRGDRVVMEMPWSPDSQSGGSSLSNESEWGNNNGMSTVVGKE